MRLGAGPGGAAPPPLCILCILVYLGCISDIFWIYVDTVGICLGICLVHLLVSLLKQLVFIELSLGVDILGVL